MQNNKDEKKEKKKKKSKFKELIKNRKFILSRDVIVIVLILSFILLDFNTTSHFPKTSTNARFSGDFKRVVRRYKNLEELSTEGTFPVPGMTETNVLEEKGRSMVPQGICTTSDYILITAYCREKNFKLDLLAHLYRVTNLARLIRVLTTETKEHRSVIYVLDKSTKEYLTTLCLEDVNHVGGITYDGRCVWIAKSSDYELSAINIGTIKKAVKQHLDSVEVTYNVTIPCDRMASFVTYFDNRLWVGFCNGAEKGNGVLDGFDISYDNGQPTLLSSKEISIPETANGAVFAKIGNQICLAVALSDGRGSRLKNTDSKICLYKVDLKKNSEITGFVDYGKYIMPPLMEELCIDGEDVYYIFESGASPYSTVVGHKCYASVDQACIGKVQNLFYWTDASYIDAFESYKLSTPSAISNDVESMYVHNYVYRINSKGENELKTVFNPNTAEMAYDMSTGVYKKALDENLSDKLSKYGYMQIYNTSNFGGYQVAKRIDSKGSFKYYKAYGSAVIGVKKVYYNKKIRFALLINFKGMDLMPIIEDSRNDGKDLLYKYTQKAYTTLIKNNPEVDTPTSSAIRKNYLKFINNNRYYSQNIQYKYDSTGINRGLNKLVNKFYDNTKNYTFRINKKKVTLSSILKDLGNDSSKYRLIVTGYGTGGTMADIFVGKTLGHEKSGYKKNVVAYTFGAAACLNKKTREYIDTNTTNIVNFYNKDDYASSLLGNYPLGNSYIFTPDRAFRKYFYRNTTGYHNLSSYYQTLKGAVDTDFAAHDYETYGHCLGNSNVLLHRVAPYNTSSINYWKKPVVLTSNSYRNFESRVYSKYGYTVKDEIDANVNLRIVTGSAVSK
ncbi:MAG: hypothetical protein K6F77_06110 [Lachnospiraceae bacterium]|nr:hypothetical protein [Lachnospiraceae bacterium]